MFGRKSKLIKILIHRMGASAFIDGRYLHVDMKISTRSKKGRQIARETALAILDEVDEFRDAVAVTSELPD